MSWISENFTIWLTELIGSALDYFGQLLNNIYVGIVEVALLNAYVINAEKFITATAIALVGLMVMKIVISGYMLETDYDSEADPFNLLVKVAQTVALIMNSNWLFNWLFQVGKDFTTDLTGSANAEGYCDKTRELLTVNGNIWHVLLLLIVLISIIIFTVVAGLRAAELIAMKLLFPFFCLDLLTNSKERWNNFFTAYLIAFFSYAIQLLFYIIAMKSYATATGGWSIYNVSTIVFLILAIRAPQFLEKYIYKSGLSSAASGGMRMVVQSAVMRGAMR